MFRLATFTTDGTSNSNNDRYSGWPMVKPLKKLNTAEVISILEDWFLEHGKPVDLRSDRGPQFRQ